MTVKKLFVTDVTLRKMHDAGDFEFGFRDRLETAKLLDKVHVDVLELPPISSRSDLLFCHTAAPILKNSTLSCNAGFSPDEAKTAAEALAASDSFRLYSVFPASVVQMEYILRKKPAAVLELIDAVTAKSASLCEESEAIFSDATRAEREFLYEAVRKAIGGGAKIITLCDDAGNMLPDEVTDFVREVIENTAERSDVLYQFDCADKMGLGSALAVAAVKGGAGGIKTSFAPEGISLSPFVKLVADAGDRIGIRTDVDRTACDRVSEKIAEITSQEKDENTPFSGGVRDNENVGAGEGARALSGADTAKTVREAVEKLGYELSEEDNARVYEEFLKVASKKSIYPHELDAIVASVALQAPSTYKLKSFVINNGNVIGATAHIELYKGDAILSGVSIGDGPIDAAFLAIEQIIGHHFELDDFQIQALTEGRGAVGSSIVKLRADSGKLYSGKGVSTDIIGSSIKAYINALNKIAAGE